MPIRGELTVGVPLLAALTLACAGLPRPAAPDFLYPPPPASDAPIVIRTARMFDGSGADPVVGPVVVVEGEHIACVATDCAVPPNALVIEVPGGTVLPGLVDLHVHFYLPGLPTHEVVDSLQIFQRPGARRALLHAGVTTIRSLGDHDAHMLNLQRMLRDDVIGGPAVVAAGPILTAVDGYWAYAMHRNPMTRRLAPHWTREIEDPTAARREVDLLADAGFQWIKVALDDRGSVPRKLDDPTVRAIVGQAHARGLRVAVHTGDEVDVQLAVAAGVDTIEHGAANGLSAASIEAMRAAGVTFDPTLGYAQVVRPTTFARQTADTMAAYQAGIRIGVGSDTQGPDSTFGRDTAKEIALLEEAGLPMSAALAAATGNGAEALGLENAIGFLRPGWQADLVVLGGDPWMDPTVVDDPVVVLQRGRVVLAPADH